MSLDKFVMRGFTSSVGSSTGSWIGRAGGTSDTPAKSVDNSGTSFVMGRGVASTRNFKAQSGASNHSEPRDEGYSFDRHDGQYHGSRPRHGILSNGGGRARGGDADSGGLFGGKGSNAIVGFWLALIVIGLMVFLSSQSSSKKKVNEWRERRSYDQSYSEQ